MTTDAHHQVLVVGGGSAGISVAARLKRHGIHGIGLVEPSATHYYQPLWTLVGGGRATAEASARPQRSVLPKGVSWIRSRVEGVDPENRTVRTADGRTIGYDRLVVCPGIQLDWNRVPGMARAVTAPHTSSNYTYELAPKTWDLIRSMRSGTAVFTMPSGPIKCGGAPQKIAYLAADHWREQGVLKDIRVVLVLPTPGMFGVPEFAEELERVVSRYGIEVHKNSELVEVDPDGRSAVVVDHASGTRDSIRFDMMHLVPPQSAPDWIKESPLADPADPAGYVQIDKHTLRHVRHPDIFALGDAGSSPNSKTGAAVRKQAPVVARNIAAGLANAEALPASYDGYSSCPITTSRHRMLLAEFDYSLRHRPTFPLIDTTHERRDMWYLKRYGLPFLYWHLMLRGRA
ncbi:pyridine nucleotide-disulfide oxidoreductase [Streptomyces yokosukanensis]|uniref:Pyridine nucleotide-disulfide oxidoreductase n=1 Tax=Streptomyces yokosukanensis TaxID=67386 RepID=A0A101NP13_9ACTN|nr:FAD/NAD(P)-binding oxidoreductase [Streptomyces yokosukanensis]KUM96392.1 pyridine nucleotide-disulfide oxidoreductase [Streptomyces yokosukanensis]